MAMAEQVTKPLTGKYSFLWGLNKLIFLICTLAQQNHNLSKRNDTFIRFLIRTPTDSK